MKQKWGIKTRMSTGKCKLRALAFTGDWMDLKKVQKGVKSLRENMESDRLMNSGSKARLPKATLKHKKVSTH